MNRNNLKLDAIEKLTINEQKAIYDEIINLCELQYRKGFQHGYEFKDAKISKRNGSLMTEKEIDQLVEKFRCDGMVEQYKYFRYPHLPNKYKVSLRNFNYAILESNLANGNEFTQELDENLGYKRKK